MSSYKISVSFGTGCYRHIQISSSATLYKLHKAILSAFDFEDDHEHAFFMDNCMWSDADCFVSARMNPGERVTKSWTLAKLELAAGDRFKYLFDYGDEWVFQCKVLRELDEETAKPVVVKCVGQAPEQYPQFEEDDEWVQDERDAMILLTEPLDQAEVGVLFEQLPMDGETQKQLHRYFDAAANLYGVIPASKLLEIYNSQNVPVSKEAFYAFAQVLRHEVSGYVLLSREEIRKGMSIPKPEQYEVVNWDVLEGGQEDYFAFLGERINKPYRILPREEFLRYAQLETFPDTLQSTAMLAYLRRKKAMLNRSPEEICQAIRMMIAGDYTLDSIMDVLTKLGFRIDSEEDADAFMQRWQALNNHTRKWLNRGYTPMELSNRAGIGPENQVSFFDDPQVLEMPEPENRKVGRNDPCPCGSGLKYKKCCGKAQMPSDERNKE